MIRYDVVIRTVEADPVAVRAEVQEHHRHQSHIGDSFLAGMQLAGQHLRIEVNGLPVGIAAVGTDGMSLCTIAAAFARYDRQILEAVLQHTGVTQAYAASWDHHHVDLFGNFARGVDNQAYQFELMRPDDLIEPVSGLRLATAVEDDLDYLMRTGFQDDYAEMLGNGALRVARLDGSEVGIGVALPQPLANGRVDIGMFTNPDVRRRGIGRSILALAAREVLAAGQQPVAGCWWRNWASRRVLEAAGFTCIGTIFRFVLDPDRFRESGE